MVTLNQLKMMRKKEAILLKKENAIRRQKEDVMKQKKAIEKDIKAIRKSRLRAKLRLKADTKKTIMNAKKFGKKLGKGTLAYLRAIRREL